MEYAGFAARRNNQCLDTTRHIYLHDSIMQDGQFRFLHYGDIPLENNKIMIELFL